MKKIINKAPKVEKEKIIAPNFLESPITSKKKEDPNSTKEEIKDSSKSTTSIYNDVNDFIDKIYDYRNDENDIFSLNELNVYYAADFESELNDNQNEMRHDL